MSQGARGPKATRESFAHRPWVHEAECRSFGEPDVFFPVAEQEGPTLHAKLVCKRCPVVTECLRWALDNGMDAGIWGGMTEQERRALKKKEWVA